MPVACPNCGTQNPDGNNFCQSCGKPLAAAAPAAAQPPAAPAAPVAPVAAPPPPGPAAASAPPPPPGYQSPYYAPAQPTAVHRTPVGLIVGIVVGLLVLMGGCGVVVAAVAAHPKPSPVAHVSTPTPEPTTAPTTAPTSAPTAGPTARPTAAPTPRPTSAPTSPTITTKTFSIAAPNFKTLKQDDFSAMLLTPNQDGTLFVQSGTLQNQSTTTDYVASVLASIGKKYPDASVCLKPKAESHGGQDGIIVGACYTYTPQNGSAYKAADVFWVSVSSSNVLYVYEVFTTVDAFDTVYNKECLGPIDSISWKD